MEQKAEIWTRDDRFTISTNKAYLDVDVIHKYLSEDSYWVNGISKELVKTFIETSSLCYGIYEGDPKGAKQVGFARVVTDFVRFSWLGDVFVLPEYQGAGLGKWLMSIIMEHSLLKGTAFNLSTKDAHTLYEKYGFQVVKDPGNKMIRPVNWDAVYEAHGLTKNAYSKG
ncbi:GNAT family N-acetyltransferase [Ectobacillus panaciterrae]|uniref:GNAT family N-acetyltransferase n=1 Tax=Ectobacillus panaciterrae TaxID=363872 RepID=UPI0003F7D765|nr:GNAT family N-acetyltransferase [Ectobacillus panaciterrae]